MEEVKFLAFCKSIRTKLLAKTTFTNDDGEVEEDEEGVFSGNLKTLWSFFVLGKGRAEAGEMVENGVELSPGELEENVFG